MNNLNENMTLRDYFAGQALAGWLADSEASSSPSVVAAGAYSFADAMLAERRNLSAEASEEEKRMSKRDLARVANSFWVIEYRGEHLKGVHYLCVTDNDCIDWIGNIEKALKLWSQKDAEALIGHMELDNAVACGHEYVDPNDEAVPR